MDIYVVGINYRTTPLEIREKLNFSGEEVRSTLKEVKQLPFVKECALISTCNRTEAYVYSEHGRFDNNRLVNLLCVNKNMDVYKTRKHFYFYSGINAVKHVFMVAMGLDSLIKGEDQILGQFKEAHKSAIEAGTSSVVLNTLLRQAVTASKKAKTVSLKSGKRASIAEATVELLNGIFKNQLALKNVLVIGAGKIGSMALHCLCKNGIGKAYITGRTRHKLESLQKSFDNVEIIEYSNRYSALKECDIVISATSSPHYTITKDILEEALAGTQREWIFIDLAVPRDIDETITELPFVKCFNIDDIKSGSDLDSNIDFFGYSIEEDIIDQYTDEFEKWYRFRGAFPVVGEVQKFAHILLQEKFNDTASKLKSLTEDEKEILKTAMSGTINTVLDKVVYSMKNCSSREDMEAYFRCLAEAFKK